jgi:uncharacterized membrane protein
MMRTGRLEAFSDGVLAIIITIMVLELKVPDEPTFEAMRAVSGPGLLTYLLSFVYIGIYWNNHHHLFQLARQVSGGVLWANLHLLFWLSVVPVSTRWLEESHLSLQPTVAYGVNLLGAAIAYTILALTLQRCEGPDSALVRAMGTDVKGKVSLACYLTGIALAFVRPWFAVVLYVVVALIWLVPDRRLERALQAEALTD